MTSSIYSPETFYTLEIHILSQRSKAMHLFFFFLVIFVRVFGQGIMDITNIEPRDKKLEEMYSSYLPNSLKVI